MAEKDFNWDGRSSTDLPEAEETVWDDVSTEQALLMNEHEDGPDARNRIVVGSAVALGLAGIGAVLAARTRKRHVSTD